MVTFLCHSCLLMGRCLFLEGTFICCFQAGFLGLALHFVMTARYWEPVIYLRVLRLQNKDARLFTARVHIRLHSHLDLDNPDSLDFRASRNKI